MVLKIRFIGVRGKIWRKGLVTDAVMSGCFNSAQLSTPKTTSAHSHEAVHHHSLTAIISILGNWLMTVLKCHFTLPRMELALANQRALVGAGMWVLPVSSRLPTRSGWSSWL